MSDNLIQKLKALKEPEVESPLTGNSWENVNWAINKCIAIVNDHNTSVKCYCSLNEQAFDSAMIEMGKNDSGEYERDVIVAYLGYAPGAPKIDMPTFETMIREGMAAYEVENRIKETENIDAIIIEKLDAAIRMYHPKLEGNRSYSAEIFAELKRININKNDELELKK